MKQQWAKLITICTYVILFLNLVFLHQSSFAQEPDQSPVPADIHAPQIVGGQEAAPHAWPWQAAIFNGPYICGGTLLDASWVLTAAHCVPEGTIAGDLSIVLGAHNIYVEEETQQRLAVEYIVVHEYFEPSSYDNDIALLKLDTPAELNEYVQTVRLTGGAEYGDEMAMIVGWGTTATGGAGSDVLLQAELPVVPLEQCQKWFEESVGFGGWITNNMICAGYEDGGVDSCQGDSGGPLMISHGEGGWSQLGIVSWGIGCAGAKRPGVYTNIANYSEWIRQQLLMGKSIDSDFTIYLPFMIEA